MKYLKLYEAFESDLLNGINKFLNKQVNRESVNKFNKDIISLGHFFDFKISDLNNSDISYLKYNDALQIKGVDSDLYCIKYWFSVDKGYIGYTGTSNVHMDITKGRIDKIPDNHLKSLSNDYKIKGTLVKCLPSELNTGDYITLYMGDDDDLDYDKLAIAIIFKNNSNLYAIQDKQWGSTPNDDSYKKYGGASWCIGTDTRFGNDNSLLYKIEVDSSMDALVYKEDSVDYINPFTWNLQLDSNYMQIPWVEFDTFYNDDYNEVGYYNMYDDWISDVKNISDIIKDSANFAVILYMKNISSKNKLRPLLDLRKDSKINAIALLNNDEFKNANIIRYIDLIFNRFNIKSGEYSNINKLVATLLKNEYIFIEFLKNGHHMNYLSSVITYLLQISNSESDKHNEEYYVEIKKLYQYRKLEYIKDKDKNIPSDILVRKIYDIYLNMGRTLVKYLKSNDINNVYELKGFFYKIKAIFDMHNDPKLYDRNVGVYFSRNFLIEIDFDESSLEKAKNMEKAVNAILR